MTIFSLIFSFQNANEYDDEYWTRIRQLKLNHPHYDEDSVLRLILNFSNFCINEMNFGL